MKKLIFVLVFVIFFIGLASAQAEIKYYIYDGSVLVRYSFDSVSNLQLKIPYDANNLKVNRDYSLNSSEGNHFIILDSAENLSISYITKSMLDKAEGGYYFTALNDFNWSVNASLTLPESAFLAEGGVISPEPSSISSDGRSIILDWIPLDSEQIVVKYTFLKDTSLIGYILLSVSIIVFVILFFLQKRSFKKKIKKVKKKVSKKLKDKNEELTRNLFEDEKRIVEYLLKKKGKEAWTKEIARDLEITKVRLSRKLRNLEQKEIIKKIPYGNENKIRIAKK